eukprot:jgi/Mesen1/1550/ME000134S00670
MGGVFLATQVRNCFKTRCGGVCTHMVQVNCGSELGLVLVEDLTSTGAPYGPEAIDRIRAVYESFPKETLDFSSRKREPVASGSGDSRARSDEEARAAAVARVEGCSAFLKAALRWSTTAGGPKAGAPELHDMLVSYYWSQSPDRELATVSKHFLHGSSPEAFASALIDTMRECFPGEVDLVIVRAALQYLAVGNLGGANRLVDELKKRSQAFAAPPIPDTPLMHFLKFLLLT